MPHNDWLDPDIAFDDDPGDPPPDEFNAVNAVYEAQKARIIELMKQLDECRKNFAAYRADVVTWIRCVEDELITEIQCADELRRLIGGSLCVCGVAANPEKFGTHHLHDCPAARR